MHHIYETQSFVLSATSSGEADRQFLLYTREFGLVRAIGQGVRELKSKLRYSLQPYSHSVVNLVKGRSGWRLTNARLEKNHYQARHGDPMRVMILARVFSLLRRMLHGEEQNKQLFDAVAGGLAFLESAQDISLPEVELVIVLRILYHLGYVGSSPSFSSALVNGVWDTTLLSEAVRERRAVLRSVNESLKASHL
ncbi:MAG: hypothetical protein A3C06_04525 [Candidatus Taylorbacteria bacterium RIFCSPHIGHO2_02_FULL_46_13]|uniref:DNA replication/recombination mediator RecO N-terminal domain-containing protein n=1 Tax=Candidatus Taylorbacteria bacterium RIFCSPHIGHO2_02_FULL_46_13 TaxID=1802312 RepID=A0A1G2MV88_9BACT|nr:MAG: hypothetical protein A3C06_04525 [Candidatus Taylorbacteria bacterium RIFCSPHIGHO2_02_FULL_46_13]